MIQRSMRTWLLLVALALVAATGVSAQSRFQFEATPGRLSKQVLPSHYALSLDVDPARDDFSGKVTITVRVRQAVPWIELHAHELTAGSARLVGAAGARKLDIAPQAGTQMWRLTADDGTPIAPGEYRIELAYTGRVHGYGEGLYRSAYTVGGAQQRMLATQLEAIYARTLFPGFDEPAYRAAFELTVRAPKADDVASNLPRASRADDGDHAIHRFPATPSMPTYLLALVVGRFDALAGKAAGVPLRVLTAPGKRDQARYALQVTQQVLPYYTQYFGVPFALPKLDQLAVPSTRWGAMEDWGLISYAEDNLLFNPARSSHETQRDVFATVAHEVAHQWFGNLVTAASWEEIWLNEAFATWLQMKATERFNPTWHVDLERRLPIDRAMDLDAGAATRAIRSGPVSETAVMDVFDAITYAKGGAVLSMLELWMGPKVFRDGLVAYMKGQRLSNATAGDLWHHIGRASNRDVASVAASWTDQQGFPLVQVRSTCEGGRLRVTLTQSRFSTSAAALPPQVWKIPVRLARGKVMSTALLDAPQRTLDVGRCAERAPLVVNAGGAGFYRVAYEPEHLQALTRRFGELAGTDRVTLVSDTFALMQAGRVAMTDYLSLLTALSRVDDASAAMLWTVASRQLEFLDAALGGTPAQQQLRAAARRLLAPQLARLGWSPRPKEDAQAGQFRAMLIEHLAQFDDAPTVQEALRRFDDDEAARARLPASMRAAVVIATGIHADRARFDRLLARLKAAEAEEDRWLYAHALAAGRDPARAAELLALSLAGVAPPNVASSIPGFVARHSPFGEQGYRFTVDNWKRLAELAGTSGSSWLLPNAARAFNDASMASRLSEDQLRAVGVDGTVLAAREAELIRLRAAVKAREAPLFGNALPGGTAGG